MEGILRQIQKLPFAKLIIKDKISEEEKITNLKREEFFAELKELTAKMKAVQSCFDAETDFDLIEAYSHELCALEQRYSYLIKKAKKEGIRAV